MNRESCFALLERANPNLIRVLYEWRATLNDAPQLIKEQTADEREAEIVMARCAYVGLVPQAPTFSHTEFSFSVASCEIPFFNSSRRYNQYTI